MVSGGADRQGEDGISASGHLASLARIHRQPGAALMCPVRGLDNGYSISTSLELLCLVPLRPGHVVCCEAKLRFEHLREEMLSPPGSGVERPSRCSQGRATVDPWGGEEQLVLEQLRCQAGKGH